MKKKWPWFSILFVVPAFVTYTLFVIVPVIYSIYYSFTKWNGGGTPLFIGVDNYIRLFGDENYWQVVSNTLQLAFFTLLFQVSLGLIFAYLLFQTLKGFRFFRSVYFMPVVVAPVAIGVMFAMFYNGDLGPINKFLGMIGLSFLEHNWLSDSNIVLYSVITPQVWQYIGLFAVILLAGMRSIPNEVIESARVDGASSMQIFFSIMIPLLWEFIGICIILAVTGSLKSFDHSWVLTAGGPGYASAYIAVLMYKAAFSNFQFGYASAITLTILVYAVSFTVLFRKLLSKFAYAVEY
jgi:raffinose/stachyose/melibiose transport system permease protein